MVGVAGDFDFLGLLVSEKSVLRSVRFNKYSVGFPGDWKYGMVAKRLHLCCQDFLKRNILATYLVKEEEKVQAWLFVYGAVEEDVLKAVLTKRELVLKQCEGEVILDLKENVREFKNLLDIWIGYKLGEIFRYDFDFDAWFVKKHKLRKKEGAICFRVQTEYTPKGCFILWIDPSIRVRYSLADYINDRLTEMGANFTVQEIGENEELRNNPTVNGILEQIFEHIMGEFAHGEGKTVNLVMFTKDGDRFVTKGKVESVIPSWTDQHPIKPTRQELLSKKRTLSDFFRKVEEKTLYEYILERKMREKRRYSPEYPVIKARTSRGSLLDFTPSDVLVQYREEKLTISPEERYNFFNEIVKVIQSKVLIDFPFLLEPVKFMHEIPEEFKLEHVRWWNWKLEVVDNTGLKPLPMLGEGGKPLGGPLRLYLVYVVPNLGKKEDVEKIVSEKNDLLKGKFNDHNLGEIVDYTVKFYDWVQLNVERTRENIRKTLRNALTEKLELPEGVAVFPIVVGPSYRGRYYEDVKRDASELGKHSQVILWDNFEGMSEEMAATLACDIYVEALIQENINNLDELDGLVWRLGRPADADGVTVYVGFDYSRDREGRISGAFALLCDSYGRLISIKQTHLSRDYITEDAARDIFVYVLDKSTEYSKKKKLRKPERLVFYRDGDLKVMERENIVRGFKRALEARGLEEKLHLDLVEVVKGHAKRMYSRYKGSIVNPQFGEYVVMPVLGSFHDGRALVVSTLIDRKKLMEGEIDFTVRPVEVRFSSYGSSKASIEKIVAEYLALTALNFWSPFRRPRLCLPLLLAHNLANLTRIGVQPKLPT